MWLIVTPALRDWRSEMSAKDVERFEAAAGDLIDELGYPRGAPHPNPEASRRGVARPRVVCPRAARRRRPAARILEELNPYISIAGCPRSSTPSPKRMVDAQ